MAYFSYLAKNLPPTIPDSHLELTPHENFRSHFKSQFASRTIILRAWHFIFILYFLILDTWIAKAKHFDSLSSLSFPHKEELFHSQRNLTAHFHNKEWIPLLSWDKGIFWGKIIWSLTPNHELPRLLLLQVILPLLKQNLGNVECHSWWVCDLGRLLIYTTLANFFVIL